MKKAIALLMAISLVMPFASVKAIEGNYYVYGKGDRVNFYINEDDEKLGEETQNAGRETIILKDDGADSEYVKALMTGFVYFSSDHPHTTVPYIETKGFVYAEDSAATTPIKQIIGKLNEEPVAVPYIKDLKESVGFITLDELVDVFGAAKQDDGTYKIDLTKKVGTYDVTIKELFTGLAERLANQAAKQNTTLFNGDTEKRKMAAGFYTSTFTDDGKIYAVEFVLNDKDELTGMEVKPTTLFDDESTTEQNVYFLVPTVYMNKTYDCHKYEVKYACYICDDEYIWSKEGSEGKECKIAEKITDKSKCVKVVPTGVSEYIAEFIGVAGICGIALVLIKRKDLFKSI